MRLVGRAKVFAVVVMMALGVGAIPAAWADVTDNFKSETSFAIWDDCHGEYILIETAYHGVVKQTVNKDGSFTFDFRVNAHGTATGLDSGTVYVFNDTYRDVETYSDTAGAVSLLQRSRFVSPGSKDNVVVTFRLGYHFDETGFYFDVDSLTTDCRG